MRRRGLTELERQLEYGIFVSASGSRSTAVAFGVSIRSRVKPRPTARDAQGAAGRFRAIGPRDGPLAGVAIGAGGQSGSGRLFRLKGYLNVVPDARDMQLVGRGLLVFNHQNGGLATPVANLKVLRVACRAVHRTSGALRYSMRWQAAPNKWCCQVSADKSTLLNRTAPKGASSDRNFILLFSRKERKTPGGRPLRCRRVRASTAVAKADGVQLTISAIPSRVGKRPLPLRQGVKAAKGFGFNNCRQTSALCAF